MPSVNSASENSHSPSTPSEVHEKALTFEEVQAAEETALGGGRVQRSALCISGGGIRSATFGLGAIQEMAELGILEQFDYLSTVSGGGYIGSWMTAWKHRKRGLANIIERLKSSAPPPSPGEIDPIQHLREYNNYLSPKLGLLSADTWTLVSTVARNMLLNWMVFIPLLLFALTLPRIVLSLARLGEVYKVAYGPIINQIMDALSRQHEVRIVGGILFAVAIFNILRYLPSVGNKDHTEADFLKFCLTPLFLASIAVLSMEAWFTGGDLTLGQDISPELTFKKWFLGITAAGAAGWLAYLIANIKTLWKNWGLILGLSLALLLTTASLSGAAWVLSKHFSDMSWPIFITVSLPSMLLAFSLAVTVFVGFTSLVLQDEDREWLSRAGAWVLLLTVIWGGFCSLSLLAPVGILRLHAKGESLVAAAGGLSGILTAVAGLSNKIKARSKDPGASQTGGPLGWAGHFAAPLFVAILLGSLALVIDLILVKIGRVHQVLDRPGIPISFGQHRFILENTRTEDAVILACIFMIVSGIMSRYININKFSLQAMYRSRIIRAYLGASNEKRHTNPFTGFADNDNLSMSDLNVRPFYVTGDDISVTGMTSTLKPFHVVNITLNLVSGVRLAWQQRKAQPFTVSALHSGYGDWYRPSAHYAGGISLGTAVAISGAAASPNMGYHSSPTMAFVMTLLNARLGAWLGNPKQKRWRDQGPRSAFGSIVREAFGLTNDSSPYVYVSDGGHFENLALYEMVKRRCRYIVVLDGGGDETYKYEDLGNALRKIRIDMKIAIQFEDPFLVPLREPQHRCAIAKIHYHAVDPTLDDGYLIYVKPCILGNEPPDVTGYKAAHDDFPHQTTADQWFDESQTESYRMLGIISVKDIFRPWGTRGFEGILDNARAYLHRDKAAETAAAAVSGKA